jgi:hypothetical protein
MLQLYLDYIDYLSFIWKIFGKSRVAFLVDSDSKLELAVKRRIPCIAQNQAV